MNFNDHYHLKGEHAFLSPSNYHWVNYGDEKLKVTINKRMSAQKGTRLHEVASDLIELGIKLPKTRSAFNRYVNDAIGFKMQPEQVLYYSDNCFGTCDTISFRKNVLRISDLKNGETKVSMKQLEVYTALFCLEYGYEPIDIEIELRLYQLDEVLVHNPDPEEIFRIMHTIIKFDDMIEKIKIGG